MSRERQVHLDWICGLLIVHMIICHVIRLETNLFETSELWKFEERVLSFFMPWFFFKSGMMFKSQSWGICLKRSFQRYIIPLIFWGGLGFAVSMILFNIMGQTPPSNYTDIKHCIATGYLGEGNGPLWYLVSLFLVVTFYNSCANHSVPDFIIAICAVLFSTHIYYNGPDWLPVLFHFTIGLFYFVCGKALSEWQYNRKAILFSAVLFIIVVTIGDASYIYMFVHKVFYGHYSLDYIYSLCVIILFNNIIKYMPSWFYRMFPLQYIGYNSMILFVAHFPIMHILSALNCKVFGIENDVLIFWYIIGGMSLILPILNYICHKPAMSWSIGIISKRK